MLFTRIFNVFEGIFRLKMLPGQQHRRVYVSRSRALTAPPATYRTCAIHVCTYIKTRVSVLLLKHTYTHVLASVKKQLRVVWAIQAQQHSTKRIIHSTRMAHHCTRLANDISTNSLKLRVVLIDSNLPRPGRQVLLIEISRVISEFMGREQTHG